MECSFWPFSFVVCLLFVCTPLLFVCLLYLAFVLLRLALFVVCFSLFCVFVYSVWCCFAPFGVLCAPFGVCLPMFVCIVWSLLLSLSIQRCLFVVYV